MNTLSTKALGAACKPCAGSKSRELYQLSRGDRKEALKLLEQYTRSWARVNKSKDEHTIVMRRKDAKRLWDLRAKLRALLGPGFPAMARALAVARELSRGV